MRPDRIVTLMNYLADKEPLIYLFLINCDFVKDDGMILGDSPAGVAYKDKRVLFYFSEEKINDYSKEKLYYLIIHEAFHILKKHHTRHKELFQKNMLIANMAEDAAINYEINSMKFNYELKPEMPEGGILPPSGFLNENSRIGSDAIETFRLFSWMIKKAEQNANKDISQLKTKVKNKQTQEEGIIRKDNENGTCEVMIKENGEYTEQKTMNKEDLVPIIQPNSSGNFTPYDDKEADYRVGFDKHLEQEQEQQKEDFNSIKDEIERNNFADNIIQQATAIEEKIKSKQPGKEVGNLTRRLKELNKPKVNWRKQLRKNMNTFISDNSYLKKKINSPVNYPWDPRSNYGILGKYPIDMTYKITNYIIFAIDTSGSCFFSEDEMKTFFTELDFAAKELEFTKTGKILTIQWDWGIREGIKEYKRGAWKNFDLRGGGGTDPTSVFNYLNNISTKRGNGYLFQDNGIKFKSNDKKTLPLLVFLTDGYFLTLKERDLKIYENNPKNILWVARTNAACYPKENFIQYS